MAYCDMSESEQHERLQRFLVPLNDLERYGYPLPEPGNHETLRRAPKVNGRALELSVSFEPSYVCTRCKRSFRVRAVDGMPEQENECSYHTGNFDRRRYVLEWRCCKQESEYASGCITNENHVHKGEKLLENYRGYVATQRKDEWDQPNKHGIYALDCEMVYTAYGTELARVSILNFRGELIYEKLVKPTNRIVNYSTAYSGITPEELDTVQTRLSDVQRDLLEMFSSKTILVGHSLESDMEALKIFHTQFADSAQLYPHQRGLPFKMGLRRLMEYYFANVRIQAARGHDSEEDARAALRLVRRKAGIPGRI